MAHDNTEYWRSLLNGERPFAHWMNRTFARVPSAPRCKMCAAPFHGPFAPVFKLAGFRQWALNQQLCRRCFASLDRRPGGAEVDVSLMFADVRDSTQLGERMSPVDFTQLMNRFFTRAVASVDSSGGVIDHVVGDGVMAMWVKGFSGADHATRALSAARDLRTRMADDKDLSERISVGAGLHHGPAFVGVVGSETGGQLDFTVLGDVPNTAARLGSAANGGEVLASRAILAAAGEPGAAGEVRMLDLKGKAEPFEAVILT